MPRVNGNPPGNPSSMVGSQPARSPGVRALCIGRIVPAGLGSLASAFKRWDHFGGEYLWGLNADDWRQRVLVRTPFTHADASAQIAAATENVEERLRAQKRSAASGRPALYRFFVTDGIAGGSQDH